MPKSRDNVTLRVRRGTVHVLIGENEAAHLFESIRELRALGVAVIYISHKMVILWVKFSP
jgi:ABC-type sugar transport system ATPase subunit